jgi:hypothetical protein
MFFAFMIFVGGLLGADSQGYGPEKLCTVMHGKYDGTVLSAGHNREYSDSKAVVPYCTAGPSTLVEDLLRDKGVID